MFTSKLRQQVAELAEANSNDRDTMLNMLLRLMQLQISILKLTVRVARLEHGALKQCSCKKDNVHDLQ